MASARSFAAVVRGAAAVFFANAAFFLCGAGGARHDEEGTWDAMSKEAVRAALVVNLIFGGVALAAVAARVGSVARVWYAAVVAFGAMVPAVEGLSALLSGFGSGKEGAE